MYRLRGLAEFTGKKLCKVIKTVKVIESTQFLKSMQVTKFKQVIKWHSSKRLSWSQRILST